MTVKSCLMGLLGIIVGIQVYYIRYDIKDRIDDFLLLDDTKWKIIISMLFAILAIIVLSIAYILLKNIQIKRQKQKISLVNKISPQQFKMQRKSLTEIELNKLQNSTEYKKYLKDKKEGKLKKVQDDSDSSITFSDDD